MKTKTEESNGKLDYLPRKLYGLAYIVIRNLGYLMEIISKDKILSIQASQHRVPLPNILVGIYCAIPNIREMVAIEFSIA